VSLLMVIFWPVSSNNNESEQYNDSQSQPTSGSGNATTARGTTGGTLATILGAVLRVVP